jgi:hypothetical protein
MGRQRSQIKMADDEAHHQAVQEIANHQRSSAAPFGGPPEHGPATESVPDPRTWHMPLEQTRPRPPRINPAALEPASTFVRSPTHADLEAAIVGQSDTPLALRVAAGAATTKQEMPDHPQGFVQPGVQDEAAPPSVVELQARATTMTGASARMAVADATSTPASDPPAPHVAPPEARVVQIHTHTRVSARASVKKAKSRRARTKVGRSVLENAGLSQA